LLEKVFEEARSKIGHSTGDKAKYQALLKGLILQVTLAPGFRFWCAPQKLTRAAWLVQALFTLMEKDIEISAREEDKDLVEAAAKDAAAEFEKDSKWTIKYTVDTELSPNRSVSSRRYSALGRSLHIQSDSRADQCLVRVSQRWRCPAQGIQQPHHGEQHFGGAPAAAGGAHAARDPGQPLWQEREQEVLLVNDREWWGVQEVDVWIRCARLDIFLRCFFCRLLDEGERSDPAASSQRVGDGCDATRWWVARNTACRQACPPHSMAPCGGMYQLEWDSWVNRYVGLY